MNHMAGSQYLTRLAGFFPDVLVIDVRARPADIVPGQTCTFAVTEQDVCFLVINGGDNGGIQWADPALLFNQGGPGGNVRVQTGNGLAQFCLFVTACRGLLLRRGFSAGRCHLGQGGQFTHVQFGDRAPVAVALVVIVEAFA